MPLSRKRRSRSTGRVLLPWLVGFIPVICGVLLLNWQAQRELHARAQLNAEHAIEQFDRVLDNIAQAARNLLPLAGQPCEQVKLPLREQVTRGTFVRSTNLFYDDALYCSSLFGSYREAVNPGDYTDGSLWLMDGNSVSPGHPLLVYRLSEGSKGAITTVDGDHLIHLLRLIDPDSDLRVQVGTHWMGTDGRVRNDPVPDFAVAPTALKSSHFSFTVHSGYPEGEVWRLMQRQYGPLFGLLVFLGIIAGVACNWQLKRANSPRAELQRALEADEFVPYFQPVVRQGDYRWAGVEVLMRWMHPRDGLVRPDLFIPYAEHSGQIIPMTRRLMQQVAEQLAPHADNFEEGFHIGINISAAHCQDLALYDDCQKLLAAFPTGRIRLTLELTERTLITPTDCTFNLFAKLHELGVMIALDDFGTGQSSLTYLRQFKVDYLKIDKSFVGMIGVDALSLHILDSIIELSNKLDMGVVAEGVETQAQRDYLAQRQVDFQQGYLFGKPLPLNGFVDALAHQKKEPAVAQPSCP